MPDEPRKIFDLMDTETEPTDEQLEELMRCVGESIRAKKRAAGLPIREGSGFALKPEAESALAGG